MSRALAKTSNPLPVSYEAAKTAIATCARIDECKDWADKAAALRVYAKQSKDKTLENNAIRIRARAVKQCGRLIEAIEPKGGISGKGKSSTGGGTTSKRKKANGAGLTKHQQDQAVNVARVPDDEFERQIESDKPPSIKDLAKQGVQPHPKATGLDRADMKVGQALWALIKNAEREAGKIDVDRALRGMTPKEIEDSIERGDVLKKWLNDVLITMRKCHG
jgi:hypothetical protein